MLDPDKVYPSRTYFQGVEKSYIVNAIIPEGVTLIVGGWGTGKTRFMLTLARAVANGDTFLGQWVTHGKILWFNLDMMDRADIKDRCAELSDGQTPGPWVNMIDWYEDEINLLQVYQTKDVNGAPAVIAGHQILANYIKQNQIKLIVFDTLHKLAISHGLKDTDNDDMALLIDALKKVTREVACGIVLLHHTPVNNDGRPRGAGSIPGGSDHILSLVGSVKDELKLHMLKARGGKIHTFPVTMREQFWSPPVPENEELPVGAWSGLITQTQREISESDLQEEVVAQKLELWMWHNGERLSNDDGGNIRRRARRQSVLVLFHGERRILNKALDYFRKKQRLITTKGADPEYTMIYPEQPL